MLPSLRQEVDNRTVMAWDEDGLVMPTTPPRSFAPLPSERGREEYGHGLGRDGLAIATLVTMA